MDGIPTRASIAICAFLVVTAAAFAGCTGTTIVPVPTPAEPSLFVDYQRTGGIAGMNDRIVIFDNGVALISTRTTSREILLNKSELDRISAVFDAAQFSSLEENYTSSRGGADFMQYSISYRGKTVNTEDTAVPSPLEPVIADMNRILNSGLTSGRAEMLPAVKISP